VDGHPLVRARITLRDAKEGQKFESVITAEDGKFEFGGVPAGKYSLTGAKRGFITASYDQHDQFSTAIVTGGGLDTESLMLKLAPVAAITGRVLDEIGEPIRHATVTLYYDNHAEGIDQIQIFRGAQTDDLGAYEITPLMPGTYFLSATAKPWYAVHPPTESAGEARDGQAAPPTVIDRSLDVAYPVTYYPDVTEADSAMPIPVRGGDRLHVEIHLNPVPALRLIFHMPGDIKTGFAFPQLEQPAFEGATPIQIAESRTVSPGVVEIEGIPAGRYNVRLRGAETNLQMNGVDLMTDREEIDTSKAEAPCTVKMSVQLRGESSLPKQLSVALRSKDRTTAGTQTVDAKGEAEFQQIAAGRYQVVVGATGKLYSIEHIAAEGAEVSGQTLTVSAGATASVSLTLVAGSVNVEGTVKRDGKAFAGSMVVLVPKNPEGNRDLFRRDQSDLDGTFSLRAVVPGSYTVLAIENGWDLDWSQPGVIAAYTKRGRAVEVGGQTGMPMTLADAVEVQSK
jgi:hypothetical protein